MQKAGNDDAVLGRRSFLAQAGVAMFAMACRAVEKRVPIAAAAAVGGDPTVTIVEFSDDGKRLRPCRCLASSSRRRSGRSNSRLPPSR